MHEQFVIKLKMCLCLWRKTLAKTQFSAVRKKDSKKKSISFEHQTVSWSHLCQCVQLLFSKPVGFIHVSQTVLQPPWCVVHRWHTNTHNKICFLVQLDCCISDIIITVNLCVKNLRNVINFCRGGMSRKLVDTNNNWKKCFFNATPQNIPLRPFICLASELEWDFMLNQ